MHSHMLLLITFMLAACGSHDRLLTSTQGTVFMRVLSAGSDTVLHQIVRMIEDAQSTKPPIQVMHLNS